MFDQLKKDIDLRQIKESEENIIADMILETTEDDFMDDIVGDPVQDDPQLEKVIDDLPENVNDEPPTTSDIDNAIEEQPDPSIDELVEAVINSELDL